MGGKKGCPWVPWAILHILPILEIRRIQQSKIKDKIFLITIKVISKQHNVWIAISMYQSSVRRILIIKSDQWLCQIPEKKAWGRWREDKEERCVLCIQRL